MLGTREDMEEEGGRAGRETIIRIYCIRTESIFKFKKYFVNYWETFNSSNLKKKRVQSMSYKW